MAKNNTSAEYNLEENSDSEGYKTFQILKFLQSGLVKFLVIILTLGMNGMIMELTLLMMLLSLPAHIFLTGHLTSLT